MGLTLLEIQALTASLAANGRVPSTVAPPAAAGTVTGIIPAAGTTPTAGTGFTYTHTNGTGVYVFTFTTAFSAAPTVGITLNQVGAGAGSLGGVYVDTITAAGFTVHTQWFSGGGGLTNADEAFSFIAQAVT